MWPERYCVVLNQIVTFGSFKEFVEASPPRGLGTTVQMLKNVCRDDTEATDLIDEAVRNPHGGNRRSNVNNVHIERPQGNSRGRALRRLRDQRPDLHARVLAKELSAHAAMIEAGFRQRGFTVPDDVDAAIEALMRRFGKLAFLSALERHGPP